MTHAANDAWGETLKRLGALLSDRPTLQVDDKVRVRADSKLYSGTGRIGTIIEVIGAIALVDWGFTVVRDHKRVPYRTHLGLVTLEHA